MDEKLPGVSGEIAPAAGGEAPNRRRRRVLIWLSIFAGVVVVIALLIIGIPLLSGSGGVSPITVPSASPGTTPPTESTPSATSDTPDVGQGTFDSALPDYLSSVLNSQNTAVLSQGGTFSNPVFVLAANSGLTQNMAPDDAVNVMGFMFTPMDPNPWDFALQDSVLAAYRSGPYGQYFPVGAIVARSHDGHVFSFIGHGSTITTMFMAASEDLLH